MLLAVGVAAASLAAAPPPHLTAAGLGPLRIGMTRAQAERAIGTHILLSEIESDNVWACAIGTIRSMPHVVLLLEELRIRVITIGGPLSTADGVRIGSSEAALRRVFGKRAKFDDRPYFGGEPNAHNVIVRLSGRREFLFQTKDGKVDTINLGDRPAIEYWEGCV